MKTVSVPTFDEFNNYRFVGYVDVKIKNVPDFHDLNKVTRPLPGIPQGGCGRHPLADLLKNGYKDVRSFYDMRQNTKKLHGYHVILKN